jgi:hypothetical protein
MNLKSLFFALVLPVFGCAEVSNLDTGAALPVAESPTNKYTSEMALERRDGHSAMFLGQRSCEFRNNNISTYVICCGANSDAYYYSGACAFCGGQECHTYFQDGGTVVDLNAR